jgi:hypothetical protein
MRGPSGLGRGRGGWLGPAGRPRPGRGRPAGPKELPGRKVGRAESEEEGFLN